MSSADTHSISSCIWRGLIEGVVARVFHMVSVAAASLKSYVPWVRRDQRRYVVYEMAH